jgi:Cdc6-like AAA superfamily ATPase
MDLQQYLEEKQKHISKSSTRIKDITIFDFNYIPEKPLMREEAKPIIDALLRYQQTGIANNMLILGSRGCGKSVLARYLLKAFSGMGLISFSFINCRQTNTSFKIIASLLNVRPRGWSLDELWEKFAQTNSGRMVFILDEVDLLSGKDKQKEILYLISRSPNNYMAILLSNNPKFLNCLDESIRSTLQPEIILFRSYNACEIEQILSERAKIGLKFLPQRIISQIAGLTTKNTNSDVRVAIKTLYLWAMEPKIPLEEHFDKARRDIMVDVIRDLNDKNLIILKAAFSHREGNVKDVYETYKRISVDMNEDPFSYMHFYSNLSYMQSLGLILLISTKINRTYTNRIQLTFDPSILKCVWEMRFG